MSGSDLLIGLLSVPILLLVSAILVGAEIAIVTVRRTELDEMVQEGRRGATAARALVDQLDRAIAAIQVGITAIGLLLGWVSESTIADAVRPHVGSGAVSHALAGGAILVLLTCLQVILGELAPKAVALQHARRVALLVAGPLLVFSRVLRPVVWVLNGGAALVLRPLRIPMKPTRRSYSVHELAILVDETSQAGALRAEQADVVQNVFLLTGKTVRDAMVPLERVGMLDLRWPSDQVLTAVIAGAHTRMPVYDGERARIVGLINTKDLFGQFRRTGAVELGEILRPLSSLSPDARVAEQLHHFRRHRLHMALVKEGATPLGILTLEDILEEIVGEIEDEHDKPGLAEPGAPHANKAR